MVELLKKLFGKSEKIETPVAEPVVEQKIEEQPVEKPVEIARIQRGDACPECGHKRFKTVSKTAGTFACRGCGAVMMAAA